MRQYLNENWQFFKKWSDNVFTSDGEPVRLPHTNVELPFNCFDEKLYQFVSGYKRNLRLDKVEGTYLLTFEGVAHQATVFVNGREMVTHNCGYTAFSVDVSSVLVPGSNSIVVRVDSRESVNQPPFGFVIDYLTYGGIYRDVYLDSFNGAFVADAYVSAQPEQPFTAKVTLRNYHADIRVHTQIYDENGVVFDADYCPKGSVFKISEEVDLKLWSVENPQLYKLRLSVDGNTYETTFGVRSARFTKDGFFLNGEKMKIVGLNRHQCFPYVGYAMPESMQRRDAQILKHKLCVNTVRTSHYPQSHYFLDECDKLGLLVFTEIPGWQHIGDNTWKAIAIHNVEEMILQYRNHPSIILWGVRINESADCDWLYEKTNALAHVLDGTRQTAGVRNFTQSHLLEDVYTFNDFNRNGATDRNLVCDKEAPYLVTEYNGHMFPTKTYDDYPHKREHVLRYTRMLNDVFGSDGTCGAIGWCMFDYNTHRDFGSGDKICYHGVMDMFRNPKMAAGVFSSLGEAPFLDVCFTTDIGDYPEGNVGEMYILTNADSVDVFKGDAFIKRYTHKDSPFKNMPNAPILVDDLIGERLTNEDGIKPKYAKLIKEVLAEIWNEASVSTFSLGIKLKILKIMKGTGLSMPQLVQLHNKYRNNWGSQATGLTLKAMKGGKVVAQKFITASDKFSLKVEASSNVLTEKISYDVAAVNVVAVDENGNQVPYVSQVVHFKTEGDIQLIGPKDVPMHGGMTGTFVKSCGKKGKGTLWVENIPIEFEVRC